MEAKLEQNKRVWTGLTYTATGGVLFVAGVAAPGISLGLGLTQGSVVLGVIGRVVCYGIGAVF